MTRQGAGFGDEIRAFFLYLWPLRSPKDPNIEKTEKICHLLFLPYPVSM